MISVVIPFLSELIISKVWLLVHGLLFLRRLKKLLLVLIINATFEMSNVCHSGSFRPVELLTAARYATFDLTECSD